MIPDLISTRIGRNDRGNRCLGQDIRAFRLNFSAFSGNLKAVAGAVTSKGQTCRWTPVH